ncbi:MAG: hypothetical protein AAGF73_19405, partial [Actinomycetota bacterium]
MSSLSMVAPGPVTVALKETSPWLFSTGLKNWSKTRPVSGAESRVRAIFWMLNCPRAGETARIETADAATSLAV